MKKYSLFLVIIIVWSGISYFLYHVISIFSTLVMQTGADFFNYKLLIQSSFIFAIILLLWKYTYLLPKVYRFLSLSLITGIFIAILFYLLKVFFASILSVLPVLLTDVDENKALINKTFAMFMHAFSIGFLSLMIGSALATLCTLIIDKIQKLRNSTHNNN